ncbi:MAG: AAA family ATPase [Spirulina sp. SIO3F2]|nr:AAA family ATPase [Spirulina sp. SIO3F2]
MLLQFTVENFLSFRETVTFSMVAAESEQRHLGHLVEDGHGHQVLPIAAIYGANGSGKSNFVMALAFAKHLISEGTRVNQSIALRSFKLDSQNQKESGFEFIFSYKEVQYSYGFRLNSIQITEEWLYCILPNEEQEILVFERHTSLDKLTEVEYGDKLRESSKEREQFLNFIAEGTRHNQLFLTEATNRNVKELAEVYSWFNNSLVIISAESDNKGLEFGAFVSEEFSDFLDLFLRKSGIGIDSILLEKTELDAEKYFSTLPEPFRSELDQAFSDADQDSMQVVEELSLGGRNFVFYKDKENQISLIQLKTCRRNQEGNSINFSLGEESDGTQRLINLSPILFSIQGRDDIVFVLDELDRRLHPLLSQYFIKEIVSSRQPGSQFIFTTHDTNLLDLNRLRRDEIWFVEKGEYGDSSLYSLVEFKIKPDMAIDKGYLNGRFGAIPFLGDPGRLGWLDDGVGESD